MERRPVERVRGTQDFWPVEAHQLDDVGRRLEETFELFGYRRVDVPVLEPAEVHLRKSGLEIISKLYAFDDQGGRRLCLRPELTASIVRACVAQPAPRLPLKVFSTGPVFRYERPSKGRFRQFTHAGVELMGAQGPLADGEVIFLAMDALDRLGLASYRVTVGHIGILAELLTKLGLSGRLRTSLLESLEQARRHGLAAVRSQLRMLDPELFEPSLVAGSDAASEVEGVATRAVLAGAPEGSLDEAGVRQAVAALLAQLGSASLGRRSEAEIATRLLRKLRLGSHREAVERALGFIERLGALQGAPAEVLGAGRALLQTYGLDDEPLTELEMTMQHLSAFGADLRRVQLDLGLSRGLQYYTGMVFEIDHGGRGGESQLCGGGRYDDLFRALGARQMVPALGFAFGVERVKLALAAEGRLPPRAPIADVFVVAASQELKDYAAAVAQVIRRAGWRADLDVAQRPLRSSLAYADREGYPQVVVVGEVEKRQGTVKVREMTKGKEHTLALPDLRAYLAAWAGSAGSAGGHGEAGRQADTYGGT